MSEQPVEEKQSSTNDENYSYKELSVLSEATDDVFAESVGDAAAADLDNYNRLVATTQKKLKIMSEDGDEAPAKQTTDDEVSDEFLRNFFIKFGMRKTLESFQQEWYELKANGRLDTSQLPDIPEIYRLNAELSDELAVLQEELDEARIIAEKARSTYDKLKK